MSRGIVALIMGAAFLSAAVPSTFGQTPAAPPSAGTTGEKKPAAAEARAVKVHGTIAAIDKDKGTVTLKGPKGRTLTLDVQDPQKLEAVKVGDPVVATYYEAVALQVRKAGQGTPGVTVEEGRAGSKPGETPAGVIARKVTVTGTITAITQGAVTIRGPEGKQETVKVKDPKNLANVKVGDLVELTYAQALAVALDKPAKDKPAK